MAIICKNLDFIGEEKYSCISRWILPIRQLQGGLASQGLNRCPAIDILT